MTARGFVIAGTASSVGKTTVSMGVIAALAARGLAVQPFKVGPDYIDPGYLSAAAGRICRNLDTWMLPRPVVRELFARAASTADIAIVEGVMGLFDGRSGSSDEGSTADLARLLGLPVVLVVDASAAARSVAATVLGFQRFDVRVRVAGVVLNGVAGEAHAAMCRDAIESTTGVRVLGALTRMPGTSTPERHLGLVPEPEAGLTADAAARLAGEIARGIDLDALLAIATEVPAAPATGLFPEHRAPQPVPIAVATDRAFHFYYQDSLDLLAAWGAELLPFSPLEDAALPTGVRAVLIGGGFPELFARELAENRAMHTALRGAAAVGLTVYGECGGLMYLARALTDLGGTRHEMVGLLDAESTMGERRLALGYREAESCGTPLLPAGERVRGHEFHWSTLLAAPAAASAAYRFTDDGGRADGFRVGSVVGTYLHTHLAARPDLAPNFVAAARAGGVTS